MCRGNYLAELERLKGIGWRVMHVNVVGAARFEIVAYPE